MRAAALRTLGPLLAILRVGKYDRRLFQLSGYLSDGVTRDMQTPGWPADGRACNTVC